MRSKKLHIIHTNDFHSHFEVWPQVAGTIKGLKESFEALQEPYLLVDIGDHMDRSHYLSEGTIGQVNVALLNQLGYNYITIGNNEGITLSKEQLSNLYSVGTNSFKVVLNNLFEENGECPSWLQPQAQCVLNDWKIGIIGTTSNFAQFYHLLGWQTKDPMAVLTQQIQALRQEVDLLILLSHLGLPLDEQIAKELDGLDIVIGAHTHHLINPGRIVKNTLIAQAGKFGQFVGHITVEQRLAEEDGRPKLTAKSRRTSAYLEPQDEKGSSRSFALEAYCIPTVEGRRDQQAIETLEKWQKTAHLHLANEITVLEQDLMINWAQESQLGNLLAESLLRWCDGDVSLVNSGQILGSLSKGKIIQGDLLSICPHPINPCVVELSGRQLWSIMQHAVQKEIENLHIKGFGFRGKILGMMSIDGMRIHYEVDEQGEKRVTDLLINGSAMEKNKIYRVATIDMFTFSPLFPEIQQAKNITYHLPEFIRDLLAARLVQGELSTAKQARWVNIDTNG